MPLPGGSRLARRARVGCGAAQQRARQSSFFALGVRTPPYHPGQAIISTGYAPNIHSYGPARVSLSASTRGVARRARAGCRAAQQRAPRSHISGRGVPTPPYHPGQAIISTDYAPNIHSYGPVIHLSPIGTVHELVVFFLVAAGSPLEVGIKTSTRSGFEPKCCCLHACSVA